MAIEMNDKKELTPTEKIRNLCHYHCIKNSQDAMWMEEFSWGGFRFDVITVDLFNWNIRGFEVKVSREDFLADKKWKNYLPYVNFFYFATLPGVITPGELPEEIGWLELRESGLVVRKKAKELQPTFVRKTYGETFLTRLLLEYIRNLCWRESRIDLWCATCNKSMTVKDGRFSKTGMPYQIAQP